MWGLDLRRGRHRRPEAPVVVHLVFADATEIVLPGDSVIARSIGQVAGLLTAR